MPSTCESFSAILCRGMTNFGIYHESHCVGDVALVSQDLWGKETVEFYLATLERAFHLGHGFRI